MISTLLEGLAAMCPEENIRRHREGDQVRVFG